MKKIAFMFVAAALFAACGEKKAPADSTVVEEVVDTNAVDTNAVDTTAVDTVNA